MIKKKVLFLCTGNSARSQMAEAFLRKYAGDHFEVHSAGLRPKGLNPYTVKVMAEVGLDLNSHQSKGVSTYLGKETFHHYITVCSQVEDDCARTFPNAQDRTLHWDHFEDPAAFVGSDEATVVKFREVRDQIEDQIKRWLAEANVVSETS